VIVWTLVHPDMRPEHLGFLPSFLSEKDPRPAREQIASNYAHGGGWNPMKGFRYTPRPMKDPRLWMLGTLKYPGDPPLVPRAMALLRKERLILYDHDFLMILQDDDSYEVSRVD
jgi:hypothetical protein